MKARARAYEQVCPFAECKRVSSNISGNGSKRQQQQQRLECQDAGSDSAWPKGPISCAAARRYAVRKSVFVWQVQWCDHNRKCARASVAGVAYASAPY